MSWVVTDASTPCHLARSKPPTMSGSSSTIWPTPCSSSCLGFELALTNLVQSFPGIFFGVLGALIGRVLMIYVFIPLQDVLARWWARRTLKRSPRLPRPRPIPPAWRPVMVLSGLRGALSLALVLSLPEALAQRNLLTDIVYGVILVTLLGQGLTLRVLLPRWKDRLVRAEVEEPLPTQINIVNDPQSETCSVYTRTPPQLSTFAGVPLWLLCPMHQGQLTSAPSWSSLAGQERS